MTNKEDVVNLSKDDVIRLLHSLSKNTLEMSQKLIVENIVTLVVLTFSLIVNGWFIYDWIKRITDNG